jgi:hypothetical protein
MTTQERSLEPAAERRTRRAILAGAAGGIGAWAASLVGRAAPTLAAAGEPVVIGKFNRAGSAMTTLQGKSDLTMLRVIQNGGHNSVAVSGSAPLWYGTGVVQTGVLGSTANGYGVRGYAVRGVGVSAYSETGSGVHGESETDGAGVRGRSQYGPGVEGWSEFGYAGYFDGKAFAGALDMPESSPGVPPANQARLFVRDNGSGKTQLCVQFATGSPIVVATEP